MRMVMVVAGVGLLAGMGVVFAAENVGTQPATRAVSNAGVKGVEGEKAATPISAEMLKRVQGELGKIKSVEADFVEEKKLAMLKHTLTIKGHFAMQQPDKLIWVVREPVRYAIRVEGEEVRQWDEDTNRVDVIHLGSDPIFRAVSEQIQAWFLGNYEALGKNYRLGVLGEKPLTLRFSPQGETMVAKMFEHIDVTFSEDEHYIEKMAISEAGGDSTTLTFVHAQVDQAIKDDVWRIPPNDH